MAFLSTLHYPTNEVCLPAEFRVNNLTGKAGFEVAEVDKKSVNESGFLQSKNPDPHLPKSPA